MAKQERTKYLIGAICVFFAAFGFAAKGIFIKSAYQYKVDTISLLMLRFLFAIPFYIVILLQQKLREKISQTFSKNTWLRAMGLGFVGYYLSAFLNFYGLNYITASLERILLFIYPTIVLLIGVMFLERKISKRQVAALGLTYLGILIAFLENLAADQQKDIVLGAFWIILSAIVYSIYLVSSDKQIAVMGSLKFTCWTMIFAFIPTSIHYFVVNGKHIIQANSKPFPPQVYAIAFSMAIFSTLLPTFMMSEGIRRVGSGNASIIASIGPIFTIFLATIFLHEAISWIQILGTLFVLIGVFIISWKGKSNQI
jgi:drug/metabolite transporter (DMT)-like permease